MDLDADLVPSIEPPLLRTVTRRTADLTAAAMRLAVVGLVLAMGPAMIRSLGSLGVTRLTMVVLCFSQLPGLVAVLPEAVVELIELGQPIRGVLLLGKLAQPVQPGKAVAVLALDPHHRCVLRMFRVLRVAGF